MELISRQEATKQKLTRYFTGKPCKYGHIAEKLLSNRTCIECLLVRKRIRNNLPHIKEENLKRLADWDTPAKHLTRTRKRQAQQLQRTPHWDSDAHLIVAKYQLAAMLTRESGTPYHVDHIVPLQGKNVSGLHVFSNLQVIPGSENVKKSNKHVL